MLLLLSTDEENLNRKQTLNYIPINGKNSVVFPFLESQCLKLFTQICFAVGTENVPELITEMVRNQKNRQIEMI